MWTRRPGDLAFTWLDRVADITAPGLAAQLRTARPTVADTQVDSATVDIVGAYLDAFDPATVTVTCVAHFATTAGHRDQPCATTVTVRPDSEGHLLVSAVA